MTKYITNKTKKQQNQIKDYRPNKLRVLINIVSGSLSFLNYYKKLETISNACDVSYSSVRRYIDQFEFDSIITTEYRPNHSSLITVNPKYRTLDFLRRLMNLLKTYGPEKPFKFFMPKNEADLGRVMSGRRVLYKEYKNSWSIREFIENNLGIFTNCGSSVYDSDEFHWTDNFGVPIWFKQEERYGRKLRDDEAGIGRNSNCAEKGWHWESDAVCELPLQLWNMQEESAGYDDWGGL